LKVRVVEAGYAVSFDAGLIGREVKLPPQFGQRPLSFSSTQSRQNVHSKEQIIASAAEGGKSLPQHSQFGRSSSIASSLPGHAFVTAHVDFETKHDDLEDAGRAVPKTCPQSKREY
jgi:hypothetical protein